MGNFCLLFRKNFKTSLRLIYLFLLEIIIILVVFSIIYYNPVKRSANYSSQSTDVEVKLLDANNITSLTTLEEYIPEYLFKNLKLSYTPKSAFATKVSNNIVKTLNMKKAIGYSNESLMISQFDPQDTIAAIVFPNVEENAPPDDFSVTIRFPSTFRTISASDSRENLWVTRCGRDDELVDATEGLYIREGFLQLQNAIFFEYVQFYKLDTTAQIAVDVRPFFVNVPPICSNSTGSKYELFLYYFAFLFTFVRLLSRYGYEIQHNVFVHHWKYGVRYPTHWCAHFFDSLLRLIILDVIVYFATKLIISCFTDDSAGTFVVVDPSLLFLFLFLYSIAMILFAIFIVCLVGNRKNAIIIGIICWIAFYSFYSTVIERIETIKSIPMFIGCVLFFNNFFGIGFSFMQRMDEGLTDVKEFPNIFIPISINIILYFILICIVQIIRPGLYMNRLCKSKTHYGKQTENKNSNLLEATPSWTNFENIPTGAEEYVELDNVSAYDSGVKILKNISMKICKGEITVILGPHESGKTTLVKVLSGMCKPSEGHVKFLKKDIYTNWKKARADCDFSLSTNPLFYYLTVSETFTYFSKIKMPEANSNLIENEVSKSLELLKPIKSIGHKQTIKTLDYEGKRLVHLCCVLTGNTKIIILDEPTSYMRLMERRLYWNILGKVKQNRAIILTSFSCDEAEIVGDRIAILNEGILKAYGSQFFLKTKFAPHFNMICKIAPMASIETITQFIKKYISVGAPDSPVGDEIVYKLPGDKCYIYEDMLVHLIKDKQKLNVIDVKVYSCTIGEIFMKVGEQKNIQVLHEQNSNYNIIYESESKISMQQIRAVLYKKMKYMHRLVISLLLVLIFVAIMLFLNPLSNMLSRFEHREYEMSLGQGDNATVDLKTFQNCTTTLITFIDHMKVGKDSIGERVYSNDSFMCLNKTFEDIINENHTLEFKPLGAISRDKNGTIVWYNIRTLHSSAYTLNMYENYRLAMKNSSKFYKVINKPLPVPLNMRVDLAEQEMIHIIVPLMFGLTMPLVLAVFIIPLVDERCKNLFILQLMAGMSLKIYFGITFIFDMLMLLMYNLILMLIMLISTFEGFSWSHKIILFGFLNIYGFVGLFLIYLISMVYNKKVKRAFLVAILHLLLTGIFSYVLYWEVFWASDVYFYIASIFPTFSIMDGISNIYLTEKEINFCRDECKVSTGCVENETMCEIIPRCCSVGFMSWGSGGILTNIAYMVAAGFIIIIAMTCVYVGERERKFSTTQNLKSYQSACNPYDDAEVIKLKKMVADLDLRDIMSYHMVVDQLESKLTDNVHSLNTVSFAAARGHSLCLFGHRHAGKTNFVKQLIGESGFKFGEVYVGGYELKSDITEAHRFMSYVPKEHGLFCLFTPRAFLTYFLTIRGIINVNIQKIIRKYKIMLDMGSFIDKKIKYLSTDQKRTVSIALALVQNTTVIIMDEPTTGLSMNVSQMVWFVIRNEQAMERTIIFTSASCLEAKYIGDNLILYQENEMLAYGSISHLRALYTIGFYIEVKFARDGINATTDEENLAHDIDNFHQFMIFLHKDSDLRSRVDNVLKYYCPVIRIKYTVLYGALEHNRTRLNILEYTINEGSIWDVVDNIIKARIIAARKT